MFIMHKKIGYVLAGHLIDPIQVLHIVFMHTAELGTLGGFCQATPSTIKR